MRSRSTKVASSGRNNGVATILQRVMAPAALCLASVQLHRPLQRAFDLRRLHTSIGLSAGGVRTLITMVAGRPVTNAAPPFQYLR